MGTDPRSFGAQSDGAPLSGEPAGVEGACANCGRMLPPPDLEAVAMDIDRTLSLEFGRMVARSDWAGRPPDGLLDGLLSFMPSVKQKRSLWDRGQALWAERMTAALSGPCEECRQSGGEPGPGAMIPPSASTLLLEGTPTGRTQGLDAMPPSSLNTPPTSALPQSGSLEAPTPAYGSHSIGPSDVHEDLPTRAAPSPLVPQTPAADEPHDLPTSAAMSPFANPPATSDEPSDLPTMAVSSGTLAEIGQGGGRAGQTEVAPESTDEEYEAHTVMIPALPPRAAGPRLLVLDGPVHGRQFSIERATTTIGRSIGCHVTIDADRVDYDHARVVRDQDGWRIEVASGAADTYVNDEPVSAPRPLRPGDVIRIGPARLRFEAAG